MLVSLQNAILLFRLNNIYDNRLYKLTDRQRLKKLLSTRLNYASLDSLIAGLRPLLDTTN